MRRSILHAQERESRTHEVRYLYVRIESTNGVVFSRLSEKSVGIWAGYGSTKRIIHLMDDGSEAVLDLKHMRTPVPPLPVLRSLSTAEPLLHVPKYQQEHF